MCAVWPPPSNWPMKVYSDPLIKSVIFPVVRWSLLLGVGHTQDQKPGGPGRSEICGEGPCHGLWHAKDEGRNGWQVMAASCDWCHGEWFPTKSYWSKISFHLVLVDMENVPPFSRAGVIYCIYTFVNIMYSEKVSTYAGFLPTTG